MTFENPIILYITPIVAGLLTLIFYISHKKKSITIEKFIAPKLKPILLASFSLERKIIKQGLLLLGIIFILVGLARPQWGHTYEEIKGKGIDVLFALDVSKSMLAQDIKPNRLERSKWAILDFLKNLKSDRVGLVAFAGSAFLQCPLTLDYDAFYETLESLNTQTILVGGTNIAAAIEAAELSFKKDDNFKILILITDGEDLYGTALQKANEAARNNLTIYTVGVGTPTGEIIQIRNKNGEVTYLKDNSGKIVKTYLDESTLKQISSLTGGFYSPLGSRGEGLEQIYQQGLKSIKPTELSSHLKEIKTERFQWFIGLGLLFLAIEIAIKNRKRIPKTLLLIFITCLSGILFPHNSQASARKGDKLYSAGNFSAAKEEYAKALEKTPDNTLLHYNLGTTLYQEKNYPQAINSLKNALSTDDVSLQQSAFYNLGNASYKNGEQILQENAQETIKQWDSSIKNYKSALEINPKDNEAKQNLEVVTKKLEELKQQQEKEDEKQDDSSDKQENDSQEKNQDQEDQEDQEKEEEKQDDSSDKQENDPEKEDPAENSNNSENEPQKEEEPEPDEQPSDSKPQQDYSPPEEQADQQPTPTGAMSQEEAEDLLDSLKGLEKKLPLGDEGANIKSSNDPNYEDW